MWVLIAWVAAGLLSLAGALTYAELSAMMPEAGGEYVYLRKSYGETLAFLFGWQRFIVAGSALIASLGVGFRICFRPLFLWNKFGLRMISTCLAKKFTGNSVSSS